MDVEGSDKQLTLTYTHNTDVIKRTASSSPGNLDRQGKMRARKMGKTAIDASRDSLVIISDQIEWRETCLWTRDSKVTNRVKFVVCSSPLFKTGRKSRSSKKVRG